MAGGFKKGLFPLALWMAGMKSSFGALMISTGNIALAPNMPQQFVSINLENTNDQPVATFGLQFNIEVEAGAPSKAAPKIMDVEILSLTIFEDDNTGATGGIVNLFRWEVGTLEHLSQPSPPGTPLIPLGTSHVSTVEFDTTGVAPGTYVLSLTTPAGPTDYFDDKGKRMNVQLFTGSLTVVPEPATGALVLAGFGMLFLQSLRRR